MKFIILIIAILVLALGWYLWTNQGGIPEAEVSDIMNDENEVQENNTEESNMEDDSDSLEPGDTVEDDSEETDTKVFNIDAHNFEFSETEMRVQEGDTVTINFSVTEGFHDLVIDEFNVATPQLNAGGEASVTFVADSAGTYEYYCSVMNHRAMGMVGTLIVE